MEDNGIYADEIQIRDLGEGKIALVLICPNKDAADGLYGMMGEQDNFEIRCYLHPVNQTISIGLTIKSFGAMLRIDSDKKEESYPPIKWLLTGKVNQITTGWLNDKQELFYTPLKPIDSLILPHQMN